MFIHHRTRCPLPFQPGAFVPSVLMNLVQLEHVKLLKEYLDLMMRFAGFPMIVHEGESLPQIQGSADAVCLVLSTYPLTETSTLLDQVIVFTLSPTFILVVSTLFALILWNCIYPQRQATHQAATQEPKASHTPSLEATTRVEAQYKHTGGAYSSFSVFSDILPHSFPLFYNRMFSRPDNSQDHRYFNQTSAYRQPHNNSIASPFD